ncbi:hypothetical protein FB45DRAFT_933496 [Roridomyces roridus]|uniref:Methyltransferase n=1 Tax=Roridomyces roridus TaxID=1738132 RepID=A0AAD7BCT5_9AGAR|nr:hypothetical protein FB45DRAFT_933496 [Roridomyces roridus]
MPSATPETVTAPLSYYSPPADGSAPYNRVNTPHWPAGDPTAQLPLSNWSPVKHSIQIENVRGKEEAYLLDEAGFQFYHSPATHKSFLDEEEIKAEYYPESAELIKKITGASRIVLFDHTIRRQIPGQVDMVSKRQPVQEVHVDQTLASATARVHLHLPPDLAPGLLQHRFQIINLWRPIGHPAFDMPLTLCDFRSVDADKELVAVARLAPDRKGETYRVRWSAEHRWKYLKGMTPEEFVLIKCFDSKEGVSVFTPHTAFQDPSMPEGSLPRESIELRALVFYD